MQRLPRDAVRQVFSDQLETPSIASPSAAPTLFHHAGSLQNLGLRYNRLQEDDFWSRYSVPPPEYADWDFSDGDFASGSGSGGVFSPQAAALSLPLQLQSLTINDGAIFTPVDSPRGFPTMLQRSRPTTYDDLLDQIEGSSSGYLPVPVHLRPQLLPRLSDFRGKILVLSMDRAGSRQLQKMIERCVDEEEIDITFSETINCIGCLMVDKFANYVLQKLVEVCSPLQVTRILKELTRKNQIIHICLNKYGIRVMQKLLKNITAQEQISLLMSALAPAVVTLVCDSNGHRVIEMCLETFPSMDIAVLYPNILDNCYTIATDKCGCRVLQEIIKSAETPFRQILIKFISRHSLPLATDLYGNYVVQFLLGLKMPGITADVLKQLWRNFATLSCNKYGSNVVEECMKSSTDPDFARIIVELLQNQQQHRLLVLDQYGNFVVTSAFSLAKERRLQLVYNLLVSHVENHHELMKSHFYGSKALKRLEKQKVRLPGRLR